jgi:hypothetical protein
VNAQVHDFERFSDFRLWADKYHHLLFSASLQWSELIFQTHVRRRQAALDAQRAASALPDCCVDPSDMQDSDPVINHSLIFSLNLSLLILRVFIIIFQNRFRFSDAVDRASEFADVDFPAAYYTLLMLSLQNENRYVDAGQIFFRLTIYFMRRVSILILHSLGVLLLLATLLLATGNADEDGEQVEFCFDLDPDSRDLLALFAKVRLEVSCNPDFHCDLAHQPFHIDLNFFFLADVLHHSGAATSHAILRHESGSLFFCFPLR